MASKQCFECDAPAAADHHVVPASLGGTRTVPLCGRCHGLVHGKRASTRELTVEGLRRRRRLGKRTGSVPFGFRLAADGETLEVDEGEAVVVRKARELRAAGLPFRHVALKLFELGFVSRAGSCFAPTQIARMIEPSASEVLEVGEF